MKLHANAALSLNQRRRLARRVVEVSERTARKWVRRYLAEGEQGLFDRPSAPKTVHNRTSEDRVQVIAALRRLRFTGAEIAELLAMATSTVSAILGRVGLGKLSQLQRPEPVAATRRAAPASSSTSTSKNSDGS
jgi:transposase